VVRFSPLSLARSRVANEGQLDPFSADCTDEHHQPDEEG
jgi:hypothetical protein